MHSARKLGFSHSARELGSLRHAARRRNLTTHCGGAYRTPRVYAFTCSVQAISKILAYSDYAARRCWPCAHLTIGPCKRRAYTDGKDAQGQPAKGRERGSTRTDNPNLTRARQYGNWFVAPARGATKHKGCNLASHLAIVKYFYTLPCPLNC